MEPFVFPRSYPARMGAGIGGVIGACKPLGKRVRLYTLIGASAGLNLGMDYLPGSITFDPVVDEVDGRLASEIVWFDAFVTNVDRTARNSNMLMWHKELWLIDHGASLYFQHSWENWEEQSLKPFTPIAQHILLPYANDIAGADSRMRETLDTFETLAGVIPNGWLGGGDSAALEVREVYAGFLKNRLENSEIFVQEALRAREALV